MVNRPLNIQIDWNAIFNTMIVMTFVIAMGRVCIKMLATPEERLARLPQALRKLNFATEERVLDRDTFIKWVETERIELLQAGGRYHDGRKPTLVVLTDDNRIYASISYGAYMKLLPVRWEDLSEETLHDAEEHGLRIAGVSLLTQVKRKEVAPYKVTVECPLCQEVIEVARAVSRTQALKRHIVEKHSGKRRGELQPQTRHISLPQTRQSAVYGAWLWIVPYETRLQTPETIPGPKWLLLDRRYGKFNSLADVRDMKPPPEAGGTYVLAIGRGDHFEWEIIGHSDTNLLPQALLIEGGEPLPPQYRDLIGWIDEPLPEYSLMMLPAVEVAEGERKIDAVLRELKRGVEGIQDSYQFRLYLTTMSKFHIYSISNLMLIMLQKPDATHVAGFVTWKDLGRWVKAEEKGIAILAPIFPPRATCARCGAKLPKGVRFCPQCGEEVEVEEIEFTPRYFKVVHVFDVSQTEGKPLPEFEVPVLTGEVNEDLFTRLLDLTKKRGIRVSFESRPYLDDPGIKGQYSPPAQIWVRPEEPRAQQLKTLLHEVAHYYSEGVFRIPRRDAETIAESAAFVIGAHHGFDTGVRSFPYVALWAKDKKVLEQNLKAIRKVATTILEGLEKTEGPERLPQVSKEYGPPETAAPEVKEIWRNALKETEAKYPIGHKLLVAEANRAGVSQEETQKMIAREIYLERRQALTEKWKGEYRREYPEEAKEEMEATEETEEIEFLPQRWPSLVIDGWRVWLRGAYANKYRTVKDLELARERQSARVEKFNPRLAQRLREMTLLEWLQQGGAITRKERV